MDRWLEAILKYQKINGNNNGQMAGGDIKNYINVTIESDRDFDTEQYIDYALSDRSNWKRVESASDLQIYYAKNSGGKDIRFKKELDDNAEFSDYWCKSFPSKSWKTCFALYYDGQLRSRIVVVEVDDARHLIAAPMQWYIENFSKKEMILAYYYLDGSREYLLTQIFNDIYPYNNDNRLMFPVFTSAESAQKAFISDLNTNKKKYHYYRIPLY